MKTPTPYIALMIAATFALGGCMQPKGNTIAEKRAYVEGKRVETLNEFYKMQPAGREIIERAAGYGVFSNIGTQFLWAGTEQGYGVIADNETGRRTYMRMGGVKGGIGFGLHGYRALFVFNDGNIMRQFMRDGWDLGADADVAATTEDTGLAAGGKATAQRSVMVYQFTDAGITAAVTLGAGKYWPDEELNR